MYEKFYTTGTPSPIEVKALHYKADASNQYEVVAFLREHGPKHYIYNPSGDEISAARKWTANSFIPSGNMVVLYPDHHFSHTDVPTFNSIFAPLPNGGKYYADDDEGVVEAHYFSADRSNVDDVLDFLRKYHANVFVTETRNEHTQKMLPCIAIRRQEDHGSSTTYVYPGSVIVVPKTGPFSVCDRDLEYFDKNYTPYTEPVLAVRDTAFYQTDETPLRTVETMLYYSDRSNRAEVEAFINSRLDGLSAWPPKYTYPAGARYELIAISVPGKKTRYLSPGMAVGIFTDTKEVDCHPVSYYDAYFTRINHPTEKETPVEDTRSLFPLQKPNETEYKIGGLETPETDYSKNRNKVYDALAMLRTPTNDDKVEITTNELMELLSDAYNEGFDFGVEVAQTNPYQNWK